MKRWRRPNPPKWLSRAKALVAESEPLSKQSVLRLLKRAVAEYEYHADALERIAEHLTSDEGDPKATEQHFGLGVREVIEMAHDDMIITARIALKPVGGSAQKSEDE